MSILDLCCKCQNKSRRKGSQRWCNDCHAEYMRENRPKYSELTEEQRKKVNARSYANVYKNRGKLIQEKCKFCGSPDTEMHHHDYDKPLDVEWLCRDCHLEHHQEI